MVVEKCSCVHVSIHCCNWINNEVQRGFKKKLKRWANKIKDKLVVEVWIVNHIQLTRNYTIKWKGRGVIRISLSSCLGLFNVALWVEALSLPLWQGHVWEWQEIIKLIIRTILNDLWLSIAGQRGTILEHPHSHIIKACFACRKLVNLVQKMVLLQDIYTRCKCLAKATT
jgi:hypothetical protein